MWLNDPSQECPMHIISMTISGGHMSWVAAMIGSIVHDWNISDILQADGSAHGIHDKTFHYSWELNGRPDDFNENIFRCYLDKSSGEKPSIHFEGIPTRIQAEKWSYIMNHLAAQDDILLIPTLAKDLREAIYCLLNIVTKNVKDEKTYLEIVTGYKNITDDDLGKISENLLDDWALMCGLKMTQRPYQSFTISDVIDNKIMDVLIDRLGKIFNRRVSENNRSMLIRNHKKMFQLNRMNWLLSEKILHEPDDSIMALKPGSMILKALCMALNQRKH